MAFERTAGGMSAEPSPAPRFGESAPSGEASPAMRLQILSTEHWSLLASRSLAWNESFSRAGMFLTTLSGAIVSLGLVGGATGFGESFTLFALVILPVVLFIGVATSIRLGASNYHEAICVIGMNRIRAAYLELAPDLERFFVMSAHDDLRGMGITMGVQPGGGRLFWLAQIIARSPILFVIALLVAAACSQPPPSASSPTPQATGGAASTLVWYADTSDLISLDPAVAYEFTGVLLAHNAYETLVKFEGADLSSIKPALAQSWDIKDSGTQWDITFKLRSGAKFASGNAITADDVVYSFQRVLKLNKSPAFLFTDIAQLKDSSIKATDPSTVVISLPKTASPQGFLAVLTFTIGSVVDSKDVKTKETGGDSGSGYLLDHSSGSGAFVIDHWTKNSEVQLKANPNYTGSPKPALGGVLVKHVPESTNQQFALEKGDADIARNLGAQQITALQGKAGVVTTTGNSLQLVYVGMNVTVKPLDNVNVRQALRTAIDYDGIVKDLFKGGAKKVQGIGPAGLRGS